MSPVKHEFGQVNAGLELEDYKLFLGLADSEGIQPGPKARFVLREFLEDWKRKNPAKIKEIRARGETYFLEHGGGQPRTKVKRGSRQ